MDKIWYRNRRSLAVVAGMKKPRTTDKSRMIKKKYDCQCLYSLFRNPKLPRIEDPRRQTNPRYSMVWL